MVSLKPFNILCVFHKEKTPSFRVWPGSWHFHCHGCGEKGNLRRGWSEEDPKIRPLALRVYWIERAQQEESGQLRLPFGDLDG